LLFGIPLALIPNPLIPYYRMIPATLLDYFFLIVISVLIGLYFSYLIGIEKLTNKKLIQPRLKPRRGLIKHRRPSSRRRVTKRRTNRRKYRKRY